MIIQNNKISAAGCFLPLSEQQDIRKSFGTRHRAALGMSEQSDAVILVVSEETGALSLAYESKLYYDLSPLEITRKLKELLDRGGRWESSVRTELAGSGQQDLSLDTPALEPSPEFPAGASFPQGSLDRGSPPGDQTPADPRFSVKEGG
jgi:diadenylate cyclase